MEERIEKVLSFNKDYANGFDIEVILNPELLDVYFYSEKKKVKHHMCLIKDYLEDYSLFISLVERYKVHSDYLITKKDNEPCIGCMLDCANQIHPTFNFACYFIILNIEIRGNSFHKQDKNTLIINCLNLFSIKDEILFFDFKKMTRYFKEYDVKRVKGNLVEEEPIKNLIFLNKLSDVLNEIEDEVSVFSDEPTFKCSVMRVIENKEKYYNKKITIDALHEKSKGSNSISHENSTQFKFINNFDEVDSSVVYDYFKNSLVKNGFLSNDDLEKYLLVAFQNKELPKKRFVFLKQDISGITNIFYIYYKEVVEKRHGKQSNYAELLGNYFEGFQSDKVVNNFARHYYKVRK